MSSPRYLSSTNFSQAFAQLDALLYRHQAIWRSLAFGTEQLDWQAQYPQLYQQLIDLTEQQLSDFDDEQCLLQWMSDFIPELALLRDWLIEPFSGELRDMVKFSDVGIPGRKKQQIVGFASAVNQFIATDGAIVDWCSGKGHLANHLHQVTGQAVTCLEYDKNLCEVGKKALTKLNIAVDFVHQDVLQPIDPAIIAQGTCHTALHACGDLHVSLMQQASRAGCRYMAFSPCCYHLTRHQYYDKLSSQAKQSQLHLDKQDLRLAVLQTVTAGERVKRLRQRELTWRIGFDLLRRSISGIAQYQPMPSINKQWLSGDFSDFVVHMADFAGLSVPSHIDETYWLTQASKKLALVSRLEKARLAFRPVMEYWLLLDRILYLQQQGYQVEVCLFCQTQASPRNTLILAKKC